MSTTVSENAAETPTTQPTETFERLPWKVLTSEAYEASQAHIGMNFGKAPMAMKVFADMSRVRGHSLEESEYREVVQVDDIPEDHETCSYPGCKHKISPFRTALVLNGVIAKDRSGATRWRGSFLVIKLKEVGLVVRGYCRDHLSAARTSAEDVLNAGLTDKSDPRWKKIHPQSFAEACARLQGILDSARAKQESRETFEASLAGPSRSTAVRGRYGSAPRNSPSNIGDRR